jgi:hypothetical protein
MRLGSPGAIVGALLSGLSCVPCVKVFGRVVSIQAADGPTGQLSLRSKARSSLAPQITHLHGEQSTRADAASRKEVTEGKENVRQ